METVVFASGRRVTKAAKTTNEAPGAREEISKISTNPPRCKNRAVWKALQGPRRHFCRFLSGDFRLHRLRRCPASNRYLGSCTLATAFCGSSPSRTARPTGREAKPSTRRPLSLLKLKMRRLLYRSFLLAVAVSWWASAAASSSDLEPVAEGEPEMEGDQAFYLNTTSSHCHLKCGEESCQ